jgi:hypothetical protein
MRHFLKSLSLLFVLMVAQQGAVVHELSHVFRTGAAQIKIDSGAGTDGACALCPAFAQVATPAFSHAFHVPLLGRAAPLLTSEPLHAATDASVPQPRSRGPPSLS